MEDITLLLNKYRETARNLWNTNFFVDENLSSYSHATLDHFQAIDRLLFASLVLDKIGKLDHANEYDKEMQLNPLPFLKVIPIVEEGVNILINRSGPPASGYWDDPVDRIKPSEVDLRFLGYFDWNSYGYIDYQYYRVRIMSFEPHPHLVGRDALLETIYARIFLDESK